MLSSSCEKNVEHSNFLTYKHLLLYSLAASPPCIFSFDKEKESYIRKHPLLFKHPVNCTSVHFGCRVVHQDFTGHINYNELL